MQHPQAVVGAEHLHPQQQHLVVVAEHPQQQLNQQQPEQQHLLLLVEQHLQQHNRLINKVLKVQPQHNHKAVPLLKQSKKLHRPLKVPMQKKQDKQFMLKLSRRLII